MYLLLVFRLSMLLQVTLLEEIYGILFKTSFKCINFLGASWVILTQPLVFTSMMALLVHPGARWMSLQTGLIRIILFICLLLGQSSLGRMVVVGCTTLRKGWTGSYVISVGSIRVLNLLTPF